MNLIERMSLPLLTFETVRLRGHLTLQVRLDLLIYSKRGIEAHTSGQIGSTQKGAYIPVEERRFSCFGCSSFFCTLVISLPQTTWDKLSGKL